LTIEIKNWENQRGISAKPSKRILSNNSIGVSSNVRLVHVSKRSQGSRARREMTEKYKKLINKILIKF